MTAPREPQAFRLLLPCLLLLSAGAAAEVRDVRMHGPNDESAGDCIDTEAADASAATAAPAAKPATTAAKPADATRIKPVITVRGGDDAASTHAPRWHSFLPGMFR